MGDVWAAKPNRTMASAFCKPLTARCLVVLFVAVSTDGAPLSYQQLVHFTHNFRNSLEDQPSQTQLPRQDGSLFPRNDISDDLNAPVDRADVIACVKRCRRHSFGVLALQCTVERCEQQVRAASQHTDVTSRAQADDSLVKVISEVMQRRSRLRKSGSDVTAPSERFNVVGDVTRTQEQQRDKRWTYMDPLKVCIAQKCEGRSEVQFYQCVYRRCLPKK